MGKFGAHMSSVEAFWCTFIICGAHFGAEKALVHISVLKKALVHILRLKKGLGAQFWV